MNALADALAMLMVAFPLYLIWITLPGGYELLSVLREIRDHLKGIRDQRQPWNKPWNKP